MRKVVAILVTALVFAGLYVFFAGGGKDIAFTEYELDEGSFKAGTLAKIESESGLQLPPGTKGLRFHYIPPIDPIAFAKLEIPAGSKDLMVQRLNEMREFSGKFHSDFANNRCNWWPASVTNVIATKFSTKGGFYIQAHLVQESDKVILYLKYFSI
jgi:hypothetical protein